MLGRRAVRLAGLLLLLGAILCPSAASAAPPGNDDFAQATTLPADSSTVTETGDNSDATGEPNEPAEYGVSDPHSEWYSWTPASSGTAVFTTCGSTLDTVMAVYTGSSVSNLTQVAFSDNNALLGCGSYDGSSAVVFQATADTTYSIQIYGANNSTGAFTLHRNPEPPNDNFAKAIGTQGGLTISGFNVSATTESGEPSHGDASVWYTWTAPVTAAVPITTCGSSFDTTLAVYTGSAVNALTAVTSNNDSDRCGSGSVQSAVTVNAIKGTTYEIAVAGNTGATGAISLHIPPVNDDFAGALPVTASAYGVNQNATAETGEPAANSGGQSVWYTWTAPFTGTANANVCIAGSDTLLAVYTGTAINALTLVTTNDDSDTCGTGSTRSAVSFPATEGTVYDIAVDSKGPAVDFTLSLPPANDNFANAQTVPGDPAVATGRTVLGTKEAGEPDHGGDPGGASIWYQWTPTSSRSVTISTCGSDYDTTLGVYTGTAVGSLATIGESDDSAFCATGSKQSAVTFMATAGTPYMIAVDGHGGVSGDVKLNLGAPANDAFANAQVLSGTSETVTGSTVGASREPGEPFHAGVAGSGSVWYRWTAPESGHVSIDTCNSTFDTLLGVYTGSALDALTEVASDEHSNFCGGGSTRSEVSFLASAGTTYMIAVDTALEEPGTLALTLGVTPFPTNDAFANATVVSGAAATVTGSNVGGTTESGEPKNAGDPGGASVWWTWTAPATQQVIIDTCGSGFDTTLGVYTGTAVGNLTSLGSDDDSDFCGSSSSASEVSFAAVTGTTYDISVDGHGGATGNVVLQVNLPANDDLTHAEAIAGASATVTGTNLGATAELGEPAHAGSAAAHSVWYTWTAPASAHVTIDTCASSSYDTRLAVYTGASLATLTAVASNDNDGCGTGSLQSSVTFAAVSGTSYDIAVDTGASSAADPGPFVLHVNPPANDRFADATTLTGATVSVTGTNANASKETGEPNHAGNAGGASVWYRWTPSLSGPVTVDTCTTAATSTLDTLLAVYTGSSVTALTPVASNDDSDACGTGSTQSTLTFDATAGTLYDIAVDGHDGAGGPFSLAIAGYAVTPEATITSAPTGTVSTVTPSFSFSANAPGSTFTCRIDATAFTACTSPYTAPALGDGAHSFDVIATDPYGNVSPVASTEFSVDASTPTNTNTTPTATTPTAMTPSTTPTSSTPTSPAPTTTTAQTTTTGTPTVTTPSAAFSLHNVTQSADTVTVVIVPGATGRATVTISVPTKSITPKAKICPARGRKPVHCVKATAVLGTASDSGRPGVQLKLRVTLTRAARLALARGVKLHATATVIYTLPTGQSAARTVRLTLAIHKVTRRR